MDIQVFRGMMILLLIILFVGVVIWAYSSGRQKDFDQAARLALEDNEHE